MLASNFYFINSCEFWNFISFMLQVWPLLFSFFEINHLCFSLMGIYFHVAYNLNYQLSHTAIKQTKKHGLNPLLATACCRLCSTIFHQKPLIIICVFNPDCLLNPWGSPVAIMWHVSLISCLCGSHKLYFFSENEILPPVEDRLCCCLHNFAFLERVPLFKLTLGIALIRDLSDSFTTFMTRLAERNF